jgi:hypothetical protein
MDLREFKVRLDLRAIIIISPALLCCTGLLFGAIYSRCAKRDIPVRARVTSIAKAEKAIDVGVEFQRLNTSAAFVEDGKVQLKVDGLWLFPVRCHRLSDLFWSTNSEHIVFTVPIGTKACRFNLGYRLGRNRYCATCRYLSQISVTKRFPKISRFILRVVPRKTRLYWTEIELALINTQQLADEFAVLKH